MQVHDIEELTDACRRAKTCPYFAAREMANTAELVFCPYSYLLDPVVRVCCMGCSCTSVHQQYLRVNMCAYTSTAAVHTLGHISARMPGQGVCMRVHADLCVCMRVGACAHYRRYCQLLPPACMHTHDTSYAHQSSSKHGLGLARGPLARCRLWGACVPVCVRLNPKPCIRADPRGHLN